MNELNPTEPTGGFQELLDNTTDTLREDKETDLPLLESLSRHVITLSPTEDAVRQALKDIEALAEKRGEILNEPIDHD